MDVGGGDSAHGKGIFLIREVSEPDSHAEEGAFLGVVEGAEIVGIDIDVEEAVSAVQAEEFREVKLYLGATVGEIKIIASDGGR